MEAHKRGIITIHICVLLWGFTAILGALISVESIPLVFWRVVMSGSILALLVVFIGWQKLPIWVWKQLALIGFLVGVHWVCFYSSIKLANASIGVVTISTASFFTAIFQPLIMRTRINWKEVALGLLIVPAILLIVGHIDLRMQQGFWVGIIAAALVGLFASLTKRLLNDYPELNVTQASMIQMWVIVVFIGAVLPLYHYFMPDAVIVPTTQPDWWYLFLLSAFCTVLPFTLSMQATRHISAFTSTLILNLEPVYGVILAILILREDKELNIWFYLGVFLLLAVVFGYSVWSRRQGGDAE
jgi:drug/metabolite transporter (DMT)-like permease